MVTLVKHFQTVKAFQTPKRPIKWCHILSCVTWTRARPTSTLPTWPPLMEHFRSHVHRNAGGFTCSSLGLSFLVTTFWVFTSTLLSISLPLPNVGFEVQPRLLPTGPVLGGGDGYQRSEKDVTLQDGCCHRPSLRCSGRGPGHMHVCVHFQWSGSLHQEQPCSVTNVALLFYAVKCILIYLPYSAPWS